MGIRWTMPAAHDLENIKTYLTQRDPQVAEPTVRAIFQRIRDLKNNPYRGRPGHRTGTREIVVSPLPYVVVYRVQSDALEVLHIYHVAQDWRA